MTAIDGGLVPDRVFMDSGVMFRGFGERANGSWAPACVALMDHCIENGKLIGISTTTVAEFVRHKDGKPFLHVKGLEPVAFDMQSANILGAKMSMATMISMKESHEGTNAYWKFDALIVATAVRWGAKILVSHDGGLRALAAAVGLNAASPVDLVQEQTELNF